ncbi:hypothetical protein [Rhodococcus sp. IEGM 1330]|uniref:hypothetical protein n=1 Tax=Rhodococcus sp. IEGM 1330 TaxID=3082225 RepID=UPI0029557456|nr:hypothetical protein [Rhodococcus sp. IEGM 1330]MDV8024962.1 hypothetical protein [Rhodococcus sp. IEGM 1330]
MSRGPYELTSADYQRASAAISHRINADGAGLRHALDSAHDEQRTEELLISVIDAFAQLASVAGADMSVVASLATRTAVQLATGKHDRKT